MKRRSIVLVVVLLLLIGMTGCKGATKSQREDEKLLVYTSFYTMADFTQKIGGEHITVVCIMPPGAEPHDWEPTPQDMRGLEEADLFVYNGAGIEGWVDRVLNSLDQEIPTIKTTEQIVLLTNEDHNHEEGHEDHEDHDHGAYDPHTWLSPINAEKEMRAIADGLIAIDPDHKDDYEANFQQYSKECGKLDAEIREELKGIKNKDLVVAHAAYGYFCDEYGLNQVAVRGYSPDGEPSPKKMAEIIEFVKENKVTVIFYEENSSPAVAKTISKDTGTTYKMLSPIEAVSKEDQEKGTDYFSLMRENLSAISEGLGGTN